MVLKTTDLQKARAPGRGDQQPRRLWTVLGHEKVPTESSPRRVHVDRGHFLPPIDTIKGPSIVIEDVDEFRPRASTLDPNTSREQANQRVGEESTMLPDLSADEFRPRASSFNGSGTSTKVKETAKRHSSQNEAEHIVHSRLPRSCSDLSAIKKPKNFRNLVNRVITDTKDPTSLQFVNRPLDLGGSSSPRHDGGMADPNVRKRTSLASLVGLVVFRKMYNAQLDVHVQKQIEDSEKKQDAVFSDSEESSDDEDEESNVAEPKFFSGLSDAAKLAYLKGYEDKLRTGLQGEYPKYKKNICRPKTAFYGQLNTKDNDGDTSPLVQNSRFGGELVKITRLIDALKVERGEHVTSKSWTSDTEAWQGKSRSRSRPRSKMLVRKFNAWAQSWSSDITR